MACSPSSDSSQEKRQAPLSALTTDLKLPMFAAAHGGMFAWPPERKCFSVLVTFS